MTSVRNPNLDCLLFIWEYKVPYANTHTHLAGNFSKMASKRPRSSLHNHFDLAKKGKSGTVNGEPDEENADGGFVDGAIVRVKMRNFV